MTRCVCVFIVLVLLATPITLAAYQIVDVLWKLAQLAAWPR